MARVKRPIAPPEKPVGRTGARPSSAAAKPKSAAAQRAALTAVADKFKSFRPAAHVLRVVRAVPTIFPQLDYATRVGGWPIERSTLIHGPSQGGKTAFVLGLMASFLKLDHFADFIDGERSTPIDWTEKLIGRELLNSPRFFAEHPVDFETSRERTRRLLNGIAELKEAGQLPLETSVVIVVDSLRKLLPKNMMDEVMKEEAAAKKSGGKDVDMGGRRWQRQAAMNAMWLDELIPLLDRAGGSFVPIARETDDPDATTWAKRFGSDYKVGGGAHVLYESSLAVRVEHAAWIYDGKPGPGVPVIGEKHRLTIWKTKVGGKDGVKTVAFFHTSNGTKYPFGFDRARDLFDLAIRFSVVEQSGAHYSYKGDRIGHGEDAAIDFLRSRRVGTDGPLVVDAVEAEVRARFEHRPPPGFDAETGEVFE